MPHSSIGSISRVTLVIVLAAFTIGACSDTKLDLPRKRRAGEIGRQTESDKADTLFGDGGLFGDSGKNGPTAQASTGGGGLAVNSYLWRATLDTVSFLPVSSADPFGGVIITDWYAPPETPNERFKLNIVLGQALRADGLKVSVFRQVIDSQGTWRDAQVDGETARKLEDAILTRARQLRNETRQLEN